MQKTEELKASLTTQEETPKPVSKGYFTSDMCTFTHLFECQDSSFYITEALLFVVFPLQTQKYLHESSLNNPFLFW
jgi:hypothetical protein